MKSNGDNDFWSEKWEYLLSEDKCPEFKNSDDEIFYKLFDKDYFAEFVYKCVKRIKELWTLYENDMA